MAISDHLSDPELLRTSWDLTPLVDGDEVGGADRLLDDAASRAEQFAQTYAGRVGELDAPAAETEAPPVEPEAPPAETEAPSAGDETRVAVRAGGAPSV